MRILVGALVMLLASPLFAERYGSPTVWMHYPPIARSARVQGDVTLKVAIDKGGKVQKADVVSGSALLSKYAAEDIKTWQFDTALRGEPETATVVVTYRFRIDESMEDDIRIELKRNANIITVTVTPRQVTE